ncbi:hypothetical protein ATY77_00055 [Rhizobium sp. R634]|uniref:hypothetical protein n=1 Tax=Rhizobium sp. R634 TaxID=1764274 RepID=UPI000B535A21|nr:hypothetical protein [Rhizobium sp. R634]OWV72281.1 hypothetical protein ATY76_05465 [Rhizobium sp. R339]OWV81686.1 hypothetical protein ATY77_00055 [Rhizobium sp. R634]
MRLHDLQIVTHPQADIGFRNPIANIFLKANNDRDGRLSFDNTLNGAKDPEVMSLGKDDPFSQARSPP